MSKLNPVSFGLSEVANLLLQLVQQVPGWEGPSKTEFDIRLRDLVQKLEHTSETLDTLLIAETVAETAAEVALL